MLNRILAGIIIIGLITLIVLDAMGILNLWGIFLTSGIALVLLGLYLFFKKHSLTGSGLFFIAGIVLSLVHFYQWIWLILLAGILLLLGGIFFFRGKKTDPLLVCGNDTRDEVAITAFCNRSECYFRSSDFKGGYVRSYFGTVRIDLSHANIQKDVGIYVDVFFGKVDIILPKYVSFSDEVVHFMGDRVIKVTSGREPRVLLRGSLVCGGLSISFK